MRVSFAAVLFALTSTSMFVDGVVAAPRNNKVTTPSKSKTGGSLRSPASRVSRLSRGGPFAPTSNSRGKTIHRRDDSQSSLETALTALQSIGTTFNNTDPDVASLVENLGKISAVITVVQDGHIDSSSSAFSDLSTIVSGAEDQIKTNIANIDNQLSQVGNLLTQVSSAVPAITSGSTECDGSSANPCPQNS